MNKKILFFVFSVTIVGFGVATLAEVSGKSNKADKITNDDINYTKNTNMVNTSLQQHFSLAFFLNYANPYYETNLGIFVKNLKNGDYLLVHGPPSSTSTIIKKVQQIRNIVSPGVNVLAVVDYRNITDISNSVPYLPKGVDYVMYDYEGGSGYSPEFSSDQNVSMGYFASARQSVEKYNQETGSNAKLLVTPPYGQLSKANWNWGLATSNIDVVDLQLQAFLNDPSLKSDTSLLVGQIQKATAGKLVFAQLSIVPQRGTIQDNINAINELKSIPGIGAFLVFYQNPQGQSLEEFFHLLQR